MSINEEISAWLKSQHNWLQEAAFRLLRQGGLEERDITDFVDLIKNPGIASTRVFPSIGGGSSLQGELRLLSIGPIVGIDDLNPRTPLTFGPKNLTVVYGTNGSGKSGYTRILSKACGKLHAVMLKPNVYRAIPEKQECSLVFSVGGVRREVVWEANSDPINDLRAVDVFDTECGRIYLEKDTELSYEPPELTLFSDLVGVCKKVEAALVEEQGALKSQLPSIPAQHVGTQAGSGLSALNKNTTEAKISSLVAWTPDDESELLALRGRLQIGDLVQAATRKLGEKKQIDQILAALQKGIDALNHTTLEGLRTSKASAVAKRKAAEEGAKAIGDTTKLEGVGSETWKAMWEAARKYSVEVAYRESEFPNTQEASRCLLCHQDLSPEAKFRLKDFEAFVKGTLETEATEAETNWESALGSVPVGPTKEAIGTACQAAGLPTEFQESIEGAWERLEKLLEPVREGSIPDGAPSIDSNVIDLVAKLKELSALTETAARELEGLAKDPDRRADHQRIAELEAKKWVSEQAVAVREEVHRLKLVAEYEDWKKRTSTTGISRKAGELSEKLITEAYVLRFNDELRRLGARRIQVELVKTSTTRGRSKHRIRLKEAVAGGVRPSEVLSEGERRIVALAAFLADVMGRNSKASFVFDDPISSLDQFFEEKVITRLVELSRERQVLVFTHRLSFLGIMSDAAGDEMGDVHIRREPWGAGQPGEIPLFAKKPERALNGLKGERVAKARKEHQSAGYDAYYPLAKAICSDFRILIERIVESVFLADVVQRHRRAVMTMNKVGNLAKITADDCALIDAMMTKYSCYEHSQSDEAPVDVPDPAELEKDIEQMLEWHKEFTNRVV